MSCHDNPNIIAWNVNTSDLWTDKLLDTSSIDWISSKDLHFRGMAIIDETLYVANSKEDKSFIGQWICKKKADVEVSKHPDKLMFISNFTGVCKICSCNRFPTCMLQTSSLLTWFFKVYVFSSNLSDMVQNDEHFVRF